ncbi:hypothetical protein CMUS01_08424 [Colletotrichum musicola]|uniref:Uncharacterized protein n=1 Tax=Colletotrichum musicola TaxID=2175873 RepID=A0A8H6ND15_9PEZI|nr:hypothetical protein CMUS01_08424 [Colletotrichum musicola]
MDQPPSGHTAAGQRGGSFDTVANHITKALDDFFNNPNIDRCLASNGLFPNKSHEAYPRPSQPPLSTGIPHSFNPYDGHPPSRETAMQPRHLGRPVEFLYLNAGVYIQDRSALPTQTIPVYHSAAESKGPWSNTIKSSGFKPPAKAIHSRNDRYDTLRGLGIKTEPGALNSVPTPGSQPLKRAGGRASHSRATKASAPKSVADLGAR